MLAMLRLIVVMSLMATVGCKPQEVAMFEASMNFDLADVQPFLAQLNSQLTLDLPVSELVEFTRATTVESERSRALTVTFQGAPVPLEYRVFMDDIDAPDLVFLTSSQALADAIDEQLGEFAEQHGM
jgi:hypothetical protein